MLDILGGLRSACTYVGAAHLKELTKRTTFVRVTAQLNESLLSHRQPETPHGYAIAGGAAAPTGGVGVPVDSAPAGAGAGTEHVSAAAAGAGIDGTA